MPQRDVIVIGASAGGIEALRTLVCALPAELAASVLVVVHHPPGVRSALPAILERAGPLRVAPVAEGPLERGTLYVAPPDHHLVVRGDEAHLSRGPTVNGHRPAVDPLFESAAHAAGPRVVGVILSGALDDGAEGMVAIARRGGVTLVQDPDEAVHDSMPREVMNRIEVDHVLPAARLGAMLGTLAGAPVPEALSASSARPGDVDPPSPFRRPALEEAIWAAYRALEESADLARRLAARARNQSLLAAAERYDRREAEARHRARLVRALVERGEHDPAEVEIPADNPAAGA